MVVATVLPHPLWAKKLCQMDPDNLPSEFPRAWKRPRTTEVVSLARIYRRLLGLQVKLMGSPKEKKIVALKRTNRYLSVNGMVLCILKL